jgi:hypothetical protein
MQRVLAAAGLSGIKPVRTILSKKVASTGFTPKYHTVSSSCSINTEDKVKIIEQNSALAVPAPVIPPSDVEKTAIELMSTRTYRSRVQTPEVQTPEPPTPVPDFIRLQNAAEQSEIQKEIDRLQSRPEIDCGTF